MSKQDNKQANKQETKPKYRAMTFLELLNEIDGANFHIEHIDDNMPDDATEEYKISVEKVWQCLDMILGMLNNKTLFYDRKREQKRLNALAEELEAEEKEIEELEDR